MKRYTFEQFKKDSSEPIDLSPARVKPPIEIVNRWMPIGKWIQQRQFELPTPKATQNFVLECMQELGIKTSKIVVEGLRVTVQLGSEQNPDTEWCFSSREIIDDIYRDTFYLRGG